MEEKKIVGTTTLDKSLEKFLVDNSESVKNRLKAFELLVKNVIFGDEEDKKSFLEITKEEIIEGYDEKFRSRFKLSLDELILVFDTIKEVLCDEKKETSSETTAK